MPPTPAALDLSRQLKRFTALMIGLQAASVLSILLVLLGFNYVVKIKLADLAQKGMRRAILAGDLREAISVLDDIRAGEFEVIEYRDKHDQIMFSIPPRAELESGYRLGHFRINYWVASDENKTHPVGQVIFDFSVLNGTQYALLLAVILIVAFIPISYRLRQRLEGRYNFELEARTNAAIAQTTQNLAHDIKNPLAIFEWARRAKSWAEFETLRDGMARSIDTIHTILADVGKKDAGLVLKRDRMTLNFPSTVTDLTRILGNASGAKITGEGPEGLPVILDWIKIERVLANLVRNAAEAGAKNIHVSGAASGNDLVVTVSDDGPGIPAEILGRLFQRGNTHGKEGGSGIGLHNVKAIIEAHGGQVEHLRENGETIFKISLPDVVWDEARPEPAIEEVPSKAEENEPIARPYALVILSDKLREKAIIDAVRSQGVEARGEEDPKAWPMVFYTDDFEEINKYPRKITISTNDEESKPVERVAKLIVQLVGSMKRQADARQA